MIYNYFSSCLSPATAAAKVPMNPMMCMVVVVGLNLNCIVLIVVKFKLIKLCACHWAVHCGQLRACIINIKGPGKY